MCLVVHSSPIQDVDKKLQKILARIVVLCTVRTAACGNREVNYVLMCLCFEAVDLKDTLCRIKIGDVILTKASTGCFAIDRGSVGWQL